MFKAYIDESEDEQNFVLAGYLARAEQWDLFSKEWSNLLNSASDYFGPPLNHFHMVDVIKSPIRMEQASLFYSIIENNVFAEVSVVIPKNILAQVVDAIDWHPLAMHNSIPSNPYYLGYNAIISELLGSYESFELSGAIDFIFDEKNEQAKIIDARDVFLNNLNPKSRSLLGSISFLNDNFVMPLQAADMLAWWIRRWEAEKSDWWNGRPFPWPNRHFIRGLTVRFDKEKLEEHFNGMHEHINGVLTRLFDQEETIAQGD